MGLQHCAFSLLDLAFTAFSSHFLPPPPPPPIFLTLSLSVAVVIGFVEPSTTVSESSDNAVVFVSVVDGTIPPGEQYIVTLTTSDDTATSKTITQHK